MKMNLGRAEAAWLIVRAFGVYCGIKAVMILPSLMISMYKYIAMPRIHIDESGQDMATYLAKTAQNIDISAFTANIIHIMLYVALAWYMLFRGKLVFNLLKRVGIGEDSHNRECDEENKND